MFSLTDRVNTRVLRVSFQQYLNCKIITTVSFDVIIVADISITDNNWAVYARYHNVFLFSKQSWM